MAPLEFLQLAGHPVRWRLLGELARSDRAVSELTALVEAPQNLVSYHLGKLRTGRLVLARRSSADRRDTYYGLDLARVGGLLAEAGVALHPGLRLGPRPTTAPAPASVLFLCTGNSARSPMAEALLRARSGGLVEVASAGSRPKPLHPNALRVMREDFGLDIAGHQPRGLEAVVARRFDHVITLCDQVREVCPEFQGAGEAVHWSLANPATGEAGEATYALFRETAAELSRRIDFLLAALSA